ncbi:MAG: EAL domain-containing protein, partial [Bacteroidota bacterium]
KVFSRDEICVVDDSFNRMSDDLECCIVDLEQAHKKFSLLLECAVQLRQPDFAVLVERALADSGLASSALEFEVTESVFLDPSKIAITKTLHEVAEMGVHLAIDDFGTGYSSLGYLKHFPFNRIKIDASFVRDIGAEADAEAIVKAIIALGRSLGKSVTAEGVETELQLAFLRRHTCDEAQGYLLARPMSAAEIERAFTSHAALSHEPTV